MFLARFEIMASKFTAEGFEPLWLISDSMKDARENVMKYAEEHLNLLFTRALQGGYFDMHHKITGRTYTISIREVQGT